MSNPIENPRRSVHQRSDAPGMRAMVPTERKSSVGTWTTGAKEGIGTAFSDPAVGPSQSNVWYTLTRGILTEVYYPDVASPDLRVLQFAITDGKTFVDLEETDTHHSVRLVHPDALIYEQTNTAKNNRYSIQKTYITNPSRHALMMKVTFTAIEGFTRDYQTFLYVNPTLNNGDYQCRAEVREVDGEIRLFTSTPGTSMVVAASCPILEASCGYAGTCDGLAELKEFFELRSVYPSSTDGNLTQIARLGDEQDVREQRTFFVAIGFGENPEDALFAATSSLDRDFESLVDEYRRGWAAYLSTLRAPTIGGVEQYNVAAMVLKAHEDKRHPGAIVASLTIPWGDKVVSTEGGIGGYHLVWSRDFYQVASTLYALGDRAFVSRAVSYLTEMQQLPDGSFPQNSWLDGTPYWRGLQLDQVAFPILLAHQTGDIGKYEDMVKPAADFIVNNGPFTPQERWEENGGYSPSTLAAEIAALVTAADMARQLGDFAAAARYLATADDWFAHIETWTVSCHGPLSQQPYYLRISDTRNPDDGHWIHIANGGGWRPKNEIVDGGFLELVRLGIKAPDDAVVTQSLDVVDEHLKFDASYGPVWRRYRFDGYGEQADGNPYQGAGIGRPWPLLTGERGEYEVAFANSGKRSSPKNLYEPESLLQSMAGAANAGHLIPEQVWDGEPIPNRHLATGQGTGSATPLAWAMAQYLRLCECIRLGRIVEMPEVVQRRYQVDAPAIGPAVQIQTPEFGSVSHRRSVTLTGHSRKGATIVLHGEEEVVTTADASGEFRAEITLWTIGKNAIRLVGYDNGISISLSHFLLFYEPKLIWAMSDPPQDDFGPGSYQYPTHPDFKRGDLDIWQLRVLADEDRIYFDIELGRLDNPWEGPSGLSKQLIDVYLFNPNIRETSTCTRGLNADFRDGFGWNRMIRISGNWRGEAQVYAYDGSPLGPVRITPQYTLRRISTAVPIHLLGGVPEAGWRIMVVTAGEENGGPRPIELHASEWDFGGGANDGRNPLIVDMIVPPEEDQRDILDWNRCLGPVRLPMIQI